MTETHGSRHTGCERRTVRAEERSDPRVERVGDVWHVRSYDAVKQVLRAKDATVQAGFNSEQVRRHRPDARHPVLFQDGADHKRQRAAIARYFAPATVSKRYRTLMEDFADELVAGIARDGEADLPAITMRYSVKVAAQVVGLTESDTDAMAARLQRFFGMPHLGAPADTRFARLVSALTMLRVTPAMMSFRRADVQPAIRRRRTDPQEDVISHLLAEGYTDDEILIECVTYGAAGMITTREFISMVVWHLLERPDLRESYLHADEKDRYRMLDEILRLEPVVGHLYRRTTEELTLVDGDDEHVVPAGSLLDLGIRQANADERAVGSEPLTVCPARDLGSGVRPEAMSFGDGPHVCPGNAIATQESDIFLTRLLALPIELVGEPRVEWDELIKGYAVRGLRVRVTR